ncbi:MAG: type II toxin-antitoxin system VapC family toxin [Vulcanimicrobiaceae bacterium]
MGASALQLLVDTHVFLWAAADPAKLSRAARTAIADHKNEVFVSAAVGWEVTIKHALGKLVLPMDPAVFVPARIGGLGFKPLPISLEHALAIGGLPAHHTDPFDRMMIAQAQVEGFTFVTADRDSLKYPVKLIKAA